MATPAVTIATPPVKIGFDRILVPTDFSDISLKALDYAKSFAKVNDATILLAHVSEAIHPVTPPEMVWFDRITAQRAAEEQLEQQVVALQLEGFRARTISLVGEIDQEILAAAEREEADLIVLGTHARGGLARVLLGSDAESIFRNAKCPILVVSPSSWPVSGANAWSPRDILFATRLDQESAPNAAFAYRLARTHSAAFSILHIEDNNGPESDDVPVLRFEQAMVALLGPNENPYVRLHISHQGKDLASTIALLATDRDADLIVVGAEEATPTQTHLPRGVVPQILAQAPCPVLVLHQK